MLDRIRSWARFTFLTPKKKIRVDQRGRPAISDDVLAGMIEHIHEFSIVEELTKVPGLRYQYIDESADYHPHNYVIVSDEIGQIIEFYLSLEDGYAGMPLSEFLIRTIPDGKTPKKI